LTDRFTWGSYRHAVFSQGLSEKRSSAPYQYNRPIVFELSKRRYDCDGYADADARQNL